MENIKGTGVALVTPFLADGDIDFNGLTNLVNHVIDGGLDYLVVLGTRVKQQHYRLLKKMKFWHTLRK